jgi:hypothetical protein
VQNLFSNLLQTAEKVIGVQFGAVPAAVAAVRSAVTNSAAANGAVSQKGMTVNTNA